MCKPTSPPSKPAVNIIMDAAAAALANTNIKPSWSSDKRQVDPVVNAINTIMYGLVVHFGICWMIERSHDNMSDDATFSSNAAATTQSPLLTTLLLHQYWITLQHANVFANPHLQHLDRQYGISLLKKNQHWGIAGTLVGYWCREIVGMVFCLPLIQSRVEEEGRGMFTTFTNTQYLILYSLIYHTTKSRGVRTDALRRFSTYPFGIMRLVIDNFYLNSLGEVILSSFRVFLQGFDTFIHYCIVRDLVLVDYSSNGDGKLIAMHILFVVWVLHAALNQLIQCSTASVMVRTWNAIASKHPLKHMTLKQNNDGGSTEEESTSSSNIVASSENSIGNGGEMKQKYLDGSDDDYIVRQLLHHERVPKHLRGRQGAASAGVDTAVRIETALTILVAFFMIGLGEVPFRVLTFGAHVGDVFLGNRQRMLCGAVYGWLLWSLLYGVWALFLRARQPDPMQSILSSHQRHLRLQSFIGSVDLVAMIAIATYVLSSQSRLIPLLASVSITGNALIQGSQHVSPKLLRRAFKVLEFMAKLTIVRTLAKVSPVHDNDLAVVSFGLTVLWLSWVVSNPIPTPCEVDRSHSKDAADVVFLGHPAELSDIWAMWLLPYSLNDRWTPPFWAFPLWPLHCLIGWYLCNHRRRIFGDRASYFCCDDVRYGETRLQNWVSAHFGRHFVTNPCQVKENIEAAARHAEAIGVKVLCLGALNKAESINGGGVGVVKALGPNRRLSIIHGNHLTAAAVVETIHQCFGDKNVKLFLTGASSKVGWAVARALKDRFGYEILCHSTDSGRRSFFKEQGFAAASTLAEGSAFTKYWIVGKYDTNVTQLIPQNATAIVFSVPHPLAGRRDVRVIEAGTLHMDLTMLDRPRVFSNKLKAHEIFACHASSVVAKYRLEERGITRIDEVGPVDPSEMDSWLVDAKMLGFSIPYVEPVADVDWEVLNVKPPVVIVGSGPAGICVAAYLSQKQIPHVVLEANDDPNVFGSWDILRQVGIEITTQKKWCNLPGFAMNEADFPNDHVSAADYQLYLKQYSHRFGINIKRGARVQSVEKRTEEEYASWIVKYTSSGAIVEEAASYVIIATGKLRVPEKNTSDDLASKLRASGIPFVHSTEMNNKQTWSNAIQAAQNGTLCMVGFGNSAADLSTLILQHSKAYKSNSETSKKPKIHIAARTVPPVFPRRASFLRVDTVGYFLRLIPCFLQELMLRFLCFVIPSTRRCNSAFPSHLTRWKKVNGRIPVIDKYGVLASGLQSGELVGHGGITNVSEEREVIFFDQPTVGNHSPASTGTKIDMVILATGYKQECLIDREDRVNGLYKCGFGEDMFLPLRSISDEARVIAEDIAASYRRFKLC